MSISVILRPNSKETKFNGKDADGAYLISIKEKAEDNKANLALIRFFWKEFKLRVKIKKGIKSRNKVLEVINK